VVKSSKRRFEGCTRQEDTEDDVEDGEDCEVEEEEDARRVNAVLPTVE